MIIKQSSLQITDNSGARFAKCIQIINKLKYGSIGDLVLVTLNNFKKGKRKIKKNTIYLGIIVCTVY